MNDDLSPEEALEEARLEVSRALSVAETAATGTAVVGRDDATNTKLRLGSAYSQIATVRKTALEKVGAAKDIIEAKRRELDEMQRALAAELVPLQKQLARLEDGISAVNLYLGRDEEILELRDGESAPADEPLVIRQSVLAMDEESALFADQGGLDFEDVDIFLEWLQADEEHLNQVIPDTKGVVTFMARRTPVDYTGEAMTNAEKNKANFQTHWLIRNGERLYVMTTDFSVGELLIPTRRSFTRMFEGLEPGSSKWVEAEERADFTKRHFMKVALILQGLVDRTAVFHPLPDGKLDLLTDAAYDAGLVRLIEDEEKAIGTGRQPFKEWQRERVALLEVGQRVIGSFPSSQGYRDDGEQFITPKYASSPSRDEPHVITRQDGSNWFFSYQRTDSVERRVSVGWGRTEYDYGPAKTKASYRIPKHGGPRAFIPVDTVEVDEMREYLAARTERKEYQSMFPALQAAIAFKLSEEESEAPFRALLAGAMGVDDAEARELVKWYKHSTKWYRPLVGDGEEERKAATAIQAEHARRAKAMSPATVAKIEQWLSRAGLRPLVLAWRTNDFIVVVPEPRRYGEQCVPQDVFVRTILFGRTGQPLANGQRPWVTLTKAQVARWTVLATTEDWLKWKLNVAPGQHLSDPAIDKLIVDIREWAVAKHGGELTMVSYSEKDNGWGRVVPKATIYWASRIDKGDLEQPYREKVITIKQGVPSWDLETGDRYRHGPSARDWRMEHSRNRPKDADWQAGFPDQSSPLVPVPPSQMNYDGRSETIVVWRDQEAIDREFVLAGQWADDQRRAKARKDIIWEIAGEVFHGWFEYEEEQRRARFVEDFGDPDLWDDHKKSQKPSPFPLNGNMGSSELHELAAAIIDGNVERSGKTVGVVLDELGKMGHRVKGFPPELLPVRFPE